MADFLNDKEFNGKNGSHFRCRLEYSYSQDTSANKSYITYDLYFVAYDGYGGSGSTNSVQGYINGSLVGYASSIADNEKKYMGSQSIEVQHNQDGTFPTTSYSASINTYWTLGSSSLDGTINLPRINRKSTFSLSKTSFDIGETIQATITQYVSGYHQNLYMVIGNNETLIQSSATGTIDIETSLLANTLYQQIPNAKYYSNEFRLKTYDSNNNLIGTETINYTANVVNSEPTFNVAYQDTNATTVAITSNDQKIIQNKSTLRIKITNANAKHYSTLSSYSININGAITTGSISSASKNVDIGTLNLSSNTNATVSITDSRGFTTTQTLAITILEYHNPLPTADIHRQANFYDATDITVSLDYSSLDGNNTVSMQYRYKQYITGTTTQWSNYYPLSDGVLETVSLDNSYRWLIEISGGDLLTTGVLYNAFVSVGTPILFVDRHHYSVGINSMPTDDYQFIVNGIDYNFLQGSTSTPKRVGKWTDGKDIYKVSFEWDSPASMDTYDLSTLGILSVDTMIDVRSIIYQGNMRYFGNTYISGSSPYCILLAYKSNTNKIQIYCPDATPSKVIITLLYTQ